MRTIWNPWHGCRRVSEGCAHCYMYFLDRLRGADGSRVYTTEAFDYPVRRDRKGRYAVPSGVTLWVCMTSDFFLEEADVWRADVWRMMRERCDVAFLLITKRVSRIAECLPSDWGSGYKNVICYATAENQKRAAERVPLLLELPFAHRGVACSPLIGAVDLSPWLGSGKIERVMCGGENYDGARPCRWEWVTDLASQCRAANVSFTFFETGNVFVKDGKTYRLSGKRLQSEMAYKSGVSFEGRAHSFDLRTPLGFPLSDEERRAPFFRAHCDTCGSRPFCSGCSNCGKCEAS